MQQENSGKTDGFVKVGTKESKQNMHISACCMA
jgi:hypothetical protein